ncbi:hypothetical protein acdb102_33480 [Acidothermaceae bacterium B102]|nr:hypothetical protein acdb102_33480 [Acidothermaceae bacterium B102]
MQPLVVLDPDAVVAVARSYPCTAEASARNLRRGWVTIELTLHPMAEFVAHGYPVERVRLSVSGGGDAYAMPLGCLNRTWEHRYPARTADPRIGPGRGELCLQYAQDPESLRWLPSDGLSGLIAIVHRHLIYEESHRRTKRWPVEDAPHGNPRLGTVHPVTTPQMQKAMTTWAR